MDKIEKINCIIKEPGKKARAHMIENSLEELQAAVGGYIETVAITTDTIMICNEEGKLLGMPHNIYINQDLPGETFFTQCPANAIDDIRGTIVIVGTTENGEELTDLDLGMQDQLLNELWEAERGRRGLK